MAVNLFVTVYCNFFVGSIRKRLVLWYIVKYFKRQCNNLNVSAWRQHMHKAKNRCWYDRRRCNVRTLPPMKDRIKAVLQFAGVTPAGHLVVKPREFVRFERRTASYPWLDHPSSRCRNWFPWRLDRTVTWSREVIVTLETTVHHSTSAPPKSHFEKTALLR